MIEAEKSVIAAMLDDAENIDEVSAILKPEMFSELNGRIFKEIVNAHEQGIIADVSYLTQRVSDERYPSDTVADWIINILADNITTIHFKTDAKVVYDEYMAKILRRTLQGQDINAANVYDVVNKLEYNLGTIEDTQSNSKTAKDIAGRYSNGYFKKRDKPLLRTGFNFLDNVIGGLDDGDMIVIGARPAVGKTAFAVQLALQIVETGYKVQLFNLEMTEKQIYERMVSYYSGIPQFRLRTAELFRNQEEQLMFDDANAKLDSIEGFMISTGSKKVSQIRQEARKTKPDLVIIDYLQLLRSDVIYKGNRYAEVGAISHAIKALAIELNIPVIVLTQLNRMSEGRNEPSMSEIRESGDIEQDASMIILLWNTDKDDPSRKGCKIEKNRHGELGKVDLVFNGSRMRFEDADGFMDMPENEELPFTADEG